MHTCNYQTLEMIIDHDGKVFISLPSLQNWVNVLHQDTKADLEAGVTLDALSILNIFKTSFENLSMLPFTAINSVEGLN